MFNAWENNFSKARCSGARCSERENIRSVPLTWLFYHLAYLVIFVEFSYIFGPTNDQKKSQVRGNDRRHFFVGMTAKCVHFMLCKCDLKPMEPFMPRNCSSSKLLDCLRVSDFTSSFRDWTLSWHKKMWLFFSGRIETPLKHSFKWKPIQNDPFKTIKNCFRTKSKSS